MSSQPGTHGGQVGGPQSAQTSAPSALISNLNDFEISDEFFWGGDQVEEVRTASVFKGPPLCPILLQFAEILKRHKELRIPAASPSRLLVESLRDHWIINAWESPQCQHFRREPLKKNIQHPTEDDSTESVSKNANVLLQALRALLCHSDLTASASVKPTAR